MPKEAFSRVFGHEHREIRDALLDLVDVFRTKNIQAVQQHLERVSKLIGPHLRYKEEALYRSLVEIFGHDYIAERLADHDRAIGYAQRLIELGQQKSLTDDEVEYAVGLIREILPHVCDSAGLSLMVERLPDQRVRTILDARNESIAANVGVLDWSNRMRKRPAVLPASSRSVVSALEMRCTD